jgi:hypothetical protein
MKELVLSSPTEDGSNSKRRNKIFSVKGKGNVKVYPRTGHEVPQGE